MANKFREQIFTAILVLSLSAGRSVCQIPVNPVAVEVIPIQNLNFGDLLAGIPKHIDYFDPINAGQFEIKVTNGNSFLIMGFILSPIFLIGPQGAILPLSYTSSDGYFKEPNQQSGTSFDPLAYAFNPKPGHIYYFYIGGTAKPSQTQRSGSYSGLIMVQVIYF